MPDKREHKRFKKRINVRYGEDEFDELGIAHDISVGGMYIECRRAPRAGTRLHLHVMDPDRDFYVEAIVARTRRADPRLGRMEKDGFGLRFLTPAELISNALPKASRTQMTNSLTCPTADALRKLLREQIASRIIVVPAADPAPQPAEVVEFTIDVQIGTGQQIEGRGRVLQIIGEGSNRQAVLEIDGADAIREALTAAIGPE